MTSDEAMQERINQTVDEMDKAAARYSMPVRLVLPPHVVAAHDQLQARMRIDWDPPTLQPQPQTLHIAGYTGPARISPGQDTEL